MMRAMRLLLAALLLLPCAAGAQQYAGMFKRGETVPLYFPTYANGASAQASGLALTDVVVYKGTSLTERTSASGGYALIDTDGLDIEGRNGINGVSIDTSDDTVADFWEPGGHYTVFADAITVDSQTVRGVWSFDLDPSVLAYGSAASGGDFTIQLASPTNIPNDILKDKLICLLGGTGALQCNLIVGWVNTTDEATVADQWITNPVAGTRYIVYASSGVPITVSNGLMHVDVRAFNGDTASAPQADAFFSGDPVPQSGDVYPLVDTEISDILTNTSGLVVVVASVTSASTTTITAAEFLAGNNNAYIGSVVWWSNGGQLAVVTSFNPATDTIGITPPFNAAPGPGDPIYLLPAARTDAFADSLAQIVALATAIESQTDDIGVAGAGLTAVTGLVDDLEAGLELLMAIDNAMVFCTVDDANFTPTDTTFACDLTDKADMLVSQDSGDLSGLEVVFINGALIREKRFIGDTPATVWDSMNNELRITLQRPLPAAPADGVLAIIR